MANTELKIEWNEVDSLLVAGCKGTEIASRIGILPETLYDRCRTDRGMKWQELTQEKRAKGDSLLRVQQFAKALGKTDKGDNTLLIWLGKNRLGQKDKEEQQITAPNDELLKLQSQFIEQAAIIAKYENQLKTSDQLHGSDTPL